MSFIITKAKLLFGYSIYLKQRNSVFDIVFISEAEVCFEEHDSAHAKCENTGLHALEIQNMNIHC